MGSLANWLHRARRWVAGVRGRRMLRTTRPWKEPRSVLCLRPFGVGDYLMTTPALAALRERFPDARLVLALNRPWTVEVARLGDWMDDVVTYEELGRTPPRAFDLALAFFPWSPKNVEVLAPLAIPLIGGFIVDHHVRSNWGAAAGSDLERAAHLSNNLAVVELVGGSVGPLDEISLGSVECEPSGRASGGLRFGVNPGGKDPFRSWSPDRFSEFLRLLEERYPRSTFVLVGGPDEKALNDELIRSSGVGSAVNTAGNGGWKDLVCLLREVDVFITGDSGPMHVAFTQRTPTVALFGPTSPAHYIVPSDRKKAIWVDIGRNPCDFGTAPRQCACLEDGRCEALAAIRPADVLRAVEALLQRSRSVDEG